ncbi:MAG: dethiobiotin synthase [Frankiales bacterium]|nr:dethiobiotin synthase [Frankiales bacterium]
MAVLVVTGTGTDVGKTVVTAALAALAAARGASVAIVKPGQTGIADGQGGDLATVQRLSGVDDLHELVRYPDPLSPAAAARRSGRAPLDLARFVATALELQADRDLVLIEGAGGLLVRYDEDGLTIADLARTLRAPVLVVCSPGLGTLNNTALTLSAIAQRGLILEGLVLGSWPAAPDLAMRSNVRDLETLGARPLLGAIPEGAGKLDRGAFLRTARASLAPALGGHFDPVAFRAAAGS